MGEQSNLYLTGLTGEYFVCAEICRHKFLALTTPKNNPMFDVIATNMTGSKSVFIQVKTKSVENTQGWKLGNIKKMKQEKTYLSFL